MNFREFIEGILGARGVNPEEIRTMLRSGNNGYKSPTMRSGDVYFDTGQDAQNTAAQYIQQGGGGDNRLGASQNQSGKGYLMNLNVPDDQVKLPNFKTDVGYDGTSVPQTYRTVSQMKPNYVSTIQRFRKDPRGPIKFGSGSMTIDRPWLTGKPRDANQFMQRYQQMFGKKQ